MEYSSRSTILDQGIQRWLFLSARRTTHIRSRVSPKRSRPESATVDEAEREEFKKAVKEVGYRDKDATVATIGQSQKTVSTDLYRAFLPVGERLTDRLSPSRRGAICSVQSMSTEIR